MNIETSLVVSKAAGYNFSIGREVVCAIIGEAVAEAATVAGSLTKNVRDIVLKHDRLQSESDQKAAKKLLTAIFDEAVATMRAGNEKHITVATKSDAERSVVEMALARHRIMEDQGKSLTGVRRDKKFNAPNPVYGKTKDAVVERVEILNAARRENLRQLMAGGSIEVDGVVLSITKTEKPKETEKAA